MKAKKILAVASSGGHWIQLQRLQKAFERHDCIYLSVNPSYKETVPEAKFYSVTDASRWSKFKLIQQAFQVFKIVKRERPDYIITTGASVGLWALFWGRLYGKKTLWIDSIANSERLSLSGRLSSIIATKTLTQWEHLAEKKIQFSGRVI